MKIVYLFFVALFLSLVAMSCNPEPISETQKEQQETFAGDPDSEEAEEEIDPND